ncbi:hypothetical protein [Burkholderia seminalis]|uniref:hypothetical protein n=1 Tax=Burkholderia seminalis TaxID=488731 RepID=UPI001639A5D1|nr:hypothetical protein [Burkholderia seminalis]
MEEQMPISVRLQYRDTRGVLWRVFEKFPGGRALLVQVERPGVSVEMRYVDIRRNFTLA